MKKREPRSRNELRQLLAQKLGEALKMDPSQIKTDAPITKYGIDSMVAVVLVGDLEELLEVQLDPAFLLDYPTIDSAAEYLRKQLAKGTAKS